MGGNSRGFSGFPYFNSPTEVGDAIADAGFNVVLQASNHTADQKLDGLLYCADFWKNKHPEVLVTGIHEDASQADDIPLLTIDDVTFAILNYTYGANTETLPLDLLGHLNLLCAVNEKNGQMDFTTLNPQVLEDISRAKELADIVIVCPHWGTEYSSKISSYQEKWALEMTEAGADVIIGTHPHVVEPVEWITAENGNESLCYYSLGNYVSTQKNALSMLEGMAWLTFHVAEDGVSIERKTRIKCIDAQLRHYARQHQNPQHLPHQFALPRPVQIQDHPVDRNEHQRQHFNTRVEILALHEFFTGK